MSMSLILIITLVEVILVLGIILIVTLYKFKKLKGRLKSI